MFDEEEAKPVPGLGVLPLDGMSVEELEEYRDALTAEIARVNAMMDQKRAHLDAAAKLFGSDL